MKLRICFGIVVWLLSVGVIQNPSLAQSSDTLSEVSTKTTPQTFYMLTYDNQTRALDIREVDIINGTNRILFTLPWINSGTPNQLFPLEERQALQDAIHSGAFLVSNGDTSGVLQNIYNVQLLDDSHLLIQTSNEVCDRTIGVCYGFYEFLKLSINDLQVTSLLKVGYDSSEFSSIEGCSADTEVLIDGILINPTQEKFSFELRPENNCIKDQEISEAVIVDYSQLLVVTQKILMASGASWSPDGNHLAYYSRESCSGHYCTTSIQVIDTGLNSKPVVIYRNLLYIHAPLFLAWLDNRTIMYQWLLDGSEGGTTVSWYDMVDQSRGDFSLDIEFSQGDVYRLESDGIANMLGRKLIGQSLVGFPAQKSAVVTANFASPNSFSYNNKFNQYAFVNLRDTAVEVIDANLQRSALDLTGILATMPNHTIIDIIPGT